MKQWKLILVTLLAVLMVCVCTSAMAEVCGECEQRSSVKAGTCTTEGTLTIYECKNKDCDNYNKVYFTGSTGIDPDNHKDLTTVARVEATCTKDGVKGHQRCACGAYLDLAGNVISAADVVIKAEHTWKVTETVKATCTEKGYVTSVCTVEGCTKTKTETLKATGHALQFKKKEAADCGNDGYDLYVCQNKGCDYSEKLHIVPATGEHDWKLSNKKAPTCDEEGFKSYTCTVCEATKKDIIATLPHTEVAWGVRKEATCSAEGIYVYGCSVCEKEVRTEAIKKDPTAHSPITVPAKNNSCTEDGYKTYDKCKDCGAILSNNGVLPVTPAYGHKFVNASIKKKATCVETGILVQICERCKKVEQEVEIPVDPEAHKTKNVEKKWETCLEDGHEAYTICELCNKKWGGAVRPAPGHNWTNNKELKAATCTEEGVMRQRCTYCDALQEVAIKKLPHKETLDYNLSYAATCTEDGLNFWVCTTCDEYTREEVLPKAEHTMRVYEIVPPTCETEGFEKWICTNGCGYTEERRTVDALGHAWKHVLNVKPTCTEKGYDYYICENEGCEYTLNTPYKTNLVDALGHQLGIKYVKEATCTKQGFTMYECVRKDCEYEVKGDIVEKLPHDYSDPSCLVLNILPTCTELGFQRYECFYCGNVKEVDVEMLPHNYAEANWKANVPATCVETGMDINYCTICGDAPKYRETAALGHKLGDVIVKTAATCTEAGEGIQKCVRRNAGGEGELCDYEITVVIDAKGHNLKETEVVPATCTGNGLKKVTCKNKCGLTKYELIPAFGHQNLEEVSKTEPTCTEAGEIVKKCADCGTTVPEVIPATGHQHTKEEIVKAPTCTEAGSNKVVCTDCNTVIETKEVAAKGHGATKEIADKAATCTEAGSINVICTVCGETLETKEVAALGHGTTKEEAVKAATCTEAGSINVICTVCGETLETKEVAALGHELDEGVVTAPTCTEDGYTTYACTRCDYTEVKDETKATGHVDTKEVETLAPTCTEAGNIDVVCACGEVVESKAVEALGHDMVAGEVTAPTCTEKGYTTYECSRCDATEIKDETEALGHTYEWVMDAVVASPAAPGENWYQCSVCEDIADIEYVKYTKYYYENTLTSFGPTTEELLGEGDWYRVTPIDLSVDGIYTFDLIASNAYVVGTVTITVSEGVMTVSYDVNANHIEVLEEALVLYASKADLAEGKGVTVAFGEEINLAETFGEDSKVLVSLMLIGTYDAAGYGVYGFEADAEEIAELLAIVD